MRRFPILQCSRPILVLVLASPDVADLWPVAELPAVRCPVPPADVPRVLPEQLHLPQRVPGVPQGVPEELSRSGLGLDGLRGEVEGRDQRSGDGRGNGGEDERDLQLERRCGQRFEGEGLPVQLLRLLPHQNVETGRVLIPEDEAGVVVVRHRVHVERPLEVHAVKRRVSCRGGAGGKGVRGGMNDDDS